MIVKRVSYFTFIVAITTIATVSSCHKAKASTSQCPEKVQAECLSVLSDEIAKETNWPREATLQLAKVLQEKGLLTGKFHISTRYSSQEETLSICLVFDKDYKGEVLTGLFKSVKPDYDYSLLFADKYSPSNFSHTFFDKRKDIDRKNLILLE